MNAAGPRGWQAKLLENGEEYFPRVNECIAQAKAEVLIETFILFEDSVGLALRAACIEAAQRGVRVVVTVDGYGSADLSEEFCAGFTAAGAMIWKLGWRPRLLTLRLNPFRRLHRKIVVIDRRIAFVGGINFSEEHLHSYGEFSKQDYAVELEGPIVGELRALLARYPMRSDLVDRNDAPAPQAERLGAAPVQLVCRDNGRHRTAIERMYRVGFRLAKQDILIANAYFFPGYRLLRDLRNAARRGVVVRLILQGHPDLPALRWAAIGLYSYLQRAGVQIYEYGHRPLHAKVAVIDDRWATIGSSNLDPVSLFLNLEANVLINDPEFALRLRGRLESLLAESCTEIAPLPLHETTWWRRLFSFLTFHLARRLPRLFSVRPSASTH